MLPQRILVVDDSASYRKLATKQLEKHGHIVVAVENGREAWELLESGEVFNMIISDYQMPEMSGLDLLARVKAHPRFWRLHFILYSSMEHVSEENKTPLDHYMTGKGGRYLRKPCRDLAAMLELDQPRERQSTK